MRFFKHLSYRTLFTKAVMGISVICLFASDGLTVSATTIKEENIAYNQSLPKEDSWHGYMIWEGSEFVWKDFDGQEHMRKKLS